MDEAMTHANFEFGDDRMLPTPLDGCGLTWPPPASGARTLLGPRATRERGAAVECVHGRMCVEHLRVEQVQYWVFSFHR